LAATAATDCQALLACLSPGFFNCLFGGSANVCYCSDATCSNGANGSCASAYNAVAGTTDPAEVLRQLQDPATTVYRVVAEGKRLGGTAACGMYCGCL